MPFYRYLSVSCRDTAKIRERTCWNELSWVVKHGSVFLNHTQNDKSMEWKHAMPPNTKYWNSRPLQIKWSCSCFGTEMGQDWNIALTKTLLLLLHHTLKYWNRSWSRWCTTGAEFCCPRGVFFAVSHQASAFHSSYHWSNQISEVWFSPTPPI
jgi:hypothetical protein